MHYFAWFYPMEFTISATSTSIVFKAKDLVVDAKDMQKTKYVQGASFGLRSSATGGKFWDPISISATGGNPAIFPVPNGPASYDIQLQYAPYSSMESVYHIKWGFSTDDGFSYTFKCPQYGVDYMLPVCNQIGTGLNVVSMWVKYNGAKYQDWLSYPTPYPLAPLAIDVRAVILYKNADGTTYTENWVWTGIDPDVDSRINRLLRTSEGTKVDKFTSSGFGGGVRIDFTRPSVQ